MTNRKFSHDVANSPIGCLSVCLLIEDIINQASDSKAKFVVSSQKCVSKAIDIANALPQQIKVSKLMRKDSRDVDFLHSGPLHSGSISRLWPALFHLGGTWLVIGRTKHPGFESPAAAFCSLRNVPEQDIRSPHQLAMVISAFHPSEVDKSSTSFGCSYGENVASVLGQVKLCDHI